MVSMNPQGKGRGERRAAKKKANKIPRQRSLPAHGQVDRGGAGSGFHGPKEGKKRKASHQRKKGGKQDWRRDVQVHRNPADVEWLVVMPHADRGRLRYVGDRLLSAGYAKDFSIRPTTEGRKQALAIKLVGVPELRVNAKDVMREAGIDARYTSASNQAVISRLLATVGGTAGFATHGRSNPEEVKGYIAADTVRKALIPYLLSDKLLWELPPAKAERMLRSQNRYWHEGRGVWLCPTPSQAREINEKAILAYRSKKGSARKNASHDKRLGAMPEFDLGSYPDSKVFDPREEAIRAVVRGVHERTPHMSWRVAKGRYVREHSPEEIIQRSWERYQDPDAVLRKRQRYELMLSKNRKSGAFRVTLEPTKAGLRYFVWPMPEGQRKPVAYLHRFPADAHAANLPAIGGRAAKSLPARKYTKSELSGWLPPEGIFAGRMKSPSRAAQTARKKAKRAVKAFEILGGGVITTIGKKQDGTYGPKDRPFAVVQVEPGKTRAFYMSTGTGGQTDSGEWNLFGGIADQWMMQAGWFIKPHEGKRVAKYAAVSQWMTDTVGSTPAKAKSFLKRAGYQNFREGSAAEMRRLEKLFTQYKAVPSFTEGRAELEDEIDRLRESLLPKFGGRLNAYLNRCGAIAGYGGAGKSRVSAKRADVAVQAEQGGKFQTVMIHPRMRFEEEPAPAPKPRKTRAKSKKKAAPKKAAPRKAAPKGGSLEDRYAAYDSNWMQNVELTTRYINDLEPPSR